MESTLMASLKWGAVGMAGTAIGGGLGICCNRNLGGEDWFLYFVSTLPSAAAVGGVTSFLNAAIISYCGLPPQLCPLTVSAFSVASFVYGKTF